MSRTLEEGALPAPDRGELALALVHEGWNHLQLQRPLAAWASWQRALRVVPEFPAAVEALSRLEAANDLPAAARGVQRFRSPGADDRRSRWDSRIRGRNLEDLDEAADLFAKLVDDDPGDSAAWFNRALCMAWLGRNPEAISCLDRSVRLDCGADPEKAVAAWSLAEVLRQGAGAEPLADDLRYLWIVDWTDEDTARLRRECPTVREVTPPLDPVTGHAQFPGASVFEWLDRPLPAPSASLAASDLPRLLATAVIANQALRLSSPAPDSLEQVHPALTRVLGDPEPSVRREAAPLPLTLLDAAVWTFRRPAGLDADTDGRLTREGVEHYFEDLWIHLPRHGLGDLTPLQAGRAAAGGDALARSRLSAVVAIREQLGGRPRTAVMYQGYPFDRLRRRLGLEPDDPASVDPEDASCMSEAELGRLDPAALGVERLSEAFRSAAALGDDQVTARFAAELLSDRMAGTPGDVAPGLFAPLVREAMRVQDRDRALAWLERARSTHGGRDRTTYDIWAAEIHARTGDPDAALAVYRALIDDGGLETALVLDAAEDLIVSGYPEHAAPLLDRATEQASCELDPANLARARSLSGER